MKKNYGINTFIMDSGERYCLVVDHSTGLPEFYPNLFLTTQIRNKGDASSTILAAASNLVVLLHFLECRDIDLHSRLLAKEFFKPHELDDLRDFAQRKQGKIPSTPTGNVLFIKDRFEASMDTVENGTLHSRLTTFANYLCWLGKHFLDDSGQEAIEQLNAMSEQIKVRRPSKKNRNSGLQDRSLNDEQLDVLFEVIRIQSDLNPFSPEVQRRNRLMILLLYHLGIRGGELLNIRIKDIDFGINRLAIVRRADEKDDPRSREPNAKTRDRILPLADTLAKELHDYIIQDRRKVQRATKNDFLFITHKIGPTVGQPISKAGYYKVISIVSVISPQLYTITGHMLRHTWNRKFSEKMDAMDQPLSEEYQEQIRSAIMGWKPGSGTGAIYTKRVIQERAYKAALSLQESNGTRVPKGLNNDEE